MLRAHAGGGAAAVLNAQVKILFLVAISEDRIGELDDPICGHGAPVGERDFVVVVRAWENGKAVPLLGWCSPDCIERRVCRKYSRLAMPKLDEQQRRRDWP